MTRQEAIDYVRRCGEDEGPNGDESTLHELFAALYDREPDADEGAQLWDLVCAAVD
jgi:hypothetical protein